MSEWKETILGDFLTFQRGFDITKKQMVEDGIYDVIFSSGFGGKHNEYKVESHGVVIGRKGTLGTVFYSEKRFWATDTTLWVKDFHGNHPKFAYYFLKTLNLGQYDCGSANPTLNRNHIHTLNIKFPTSTTEQKQIADVLSCLDAKIENLRRQNETLEQIAQTIFKHWFIDFEFPNADGKPYKSSGGAMVASAIGDIPEGWKVGKLGDIVEVFMGYPFKSELYSFNSGIKVVRGENVSLGFLRWDTEKRWEYDLDSYTDYFLSVNDYVIGMDGSRVGRNRTIILDSDLPLILAQRVARLRTKDKHTQGYINILLMNNRFEKYVDFIKTGTSIPHISGQQIKDFECIIPLKKQIEKFSGFYNAWSQKISVIRQQIQTLTKTRDSLLPKLMSGQLRVKE
ncbi:restriction endonuclease subunit S [Phormidium tenue]|jgi:type I restriction enzyme S subunit|uniref:Restriction endonuclease subunit S n=1 Tax=Phormidium tenue FACHB-1050 TaxID=2692857 RepID=A0ABR8CCF2_9CYAN|nr:restriction endonuclease subunit S [Phormidium tenue]MBD2318281.1 restriction endonuclease subunit S [Phormidium tenue FACHB-1050]